MRHFLISSQYGIELSDREALFVLSSKEKVDLFFRTIGLTYSLNENILLVSILSKDAHLKLRQINEFFEEI